MSELGILGGHVRSQVFDDRGSQIAFTCDICTLHPQDWTRRKVSYPRLKYRAIQKPFAGAGHDVFTDVVVSPLQRFHGLLFGAVPSVRVFVEGQNIHQGSLLAFFLNTFLLIHAGLGQRIQDLLAEGRSLGGTGGCCGCELKSLSRDQSTLSLG